VPGCGLFGRRWRNIKHVVETLARRGVIGGSFCRSVTAAHWLAEMSKRRQGHDQGQHGTAGDRFAQQCRQAMDNVEALLAAGRMTKADIVKATYFVTRPTDLPSLGEIRRERWGTSQPPSVTTIVVAALARLDYLIEIEVVAAAI